MNRRLVIVFVLVAMVLLIGITVYRFVQNLNQSHRQIGWDKQMEPVAYATAPLQKLPSQSFSISS